MAFPFTLNIAGSDIPTVQTAITDQGGFTNGDILIGGGINGGNAISITGLQYLKFLSSGRFNYGKGAISMWVKTNWDPNVVSSTYRYLFQGNWSATQRLDIWAYDGGSHQPNVRPYFYPAGLGLPAFAGPPSGNVWHLFELYWDMTAGANSFCLGKWDDKYFPWFTFPARTPDIIDPARYMFIGYNLDGCVASFSCYDDPAGLLPVGASEFPTTSTLALVSILANAGATQITVSATNFMTVGRLIQIPINYGTSLHNAVIQSVVGNVVTFAPAIPPGRTAPAGGKIIGRAYNPWIPATEDKVKALFPDGDGFCSPWETHATNPIDCPLLSAVVHAGEDVLFFKKYHLENVYEGCVPTTGEIEDAFTWKGNPGEIHTLFFNVHTRIALPNVEVGYEQFSGPHGVIAKANVDLRIVKNWWQGGDQGGYDHAAVPTWVGELLLHNDTITPETDQTIKYDDLKAPTIPIQDHVTTAIAAATSRQFAMIVDIPADAAPGDYAGTVTLKNNGVVIATRVITLTVLPFALQDHDVIRTVYHWPSNEQGIVAIMGLDKWDVFEKDINLLRSLGYNGISLACYYWNDAPGGAGGIGIAGIDTAINLIAAAGFKSLAIYGVTAGVDTGLTTRYTQGLVNLLNASGIANTYLQGEDEFTHQTLTTVSGINGLTVAIDTVAKTLTLPSGTWISYGLRAQSHQLLHLLGCTSAGNHGVYTSSYLDGAVFHYASTTAPSPVTEAGNGSQSIMDGHWELMARKAKHIHNIGGKVYTTTESLNDTATYCLAANQAIFSAANYPLPGDLAGDPSLDFLHYNDSQTGIKTTPPIRRLPGVIEGFYTNVRDGVVLWNRLNLGYTPYLSGASFAGMSWNSAASSYNEFNNGYRSSGISYPSVLSDTPAADNFNPVPTFNAIAHREGIKDAKYLTTWDYWYNRVKTFRPNAAADSKAIVDPIKARYVTPAAGANPSVTVPFSKWDEDREAIISEILTLKNLSLYCRGLVCGVIPKKVDGKNARKVAGARL